MFAKPSAFWKGSLIFVWYRLDHAGRLCFLQVSHGSVADPMRHYAYLLQEICRPKYQDCQNLIFAEGDAGSTEQVVLSLVSTLREM